MKYEAGLVKSFVNLDAWQESHKLAIMIYDLTKQFPKEEIFGLTNQMRRCAVSVVSNIAEGFNRRSSKEKIRFYFISLGSVAEMQSQLLIARDVKYINNDNFSPIAKQTVKVHKILNGLIKKTRSMLPAS